MLKAGTAARRQSVRLDEPIAAEAVRRGVERFLRRLDERLQARDPSWVGHCKLLVASADSTAYASTTAAGDKPRWAGAPTGLAAAELTIYVAIYGWSDGDVAEVLHRLLEQEPILTGPVATAH